MYFGYDRLLDSLEQLLCDLNPSHHRSLFLHRTFYTNLNIHKDVKISRRCKRHVVNKTTLPNFGFFDLEKVFIPVHDSDHWTMYVIYPRRKHLVFYDSLNLREPSNLQPQGIHNHVQDECEDARLQYCPQHWKYYRAEVLQQGNGMDCGFCLIKHAIIGWNQIIQKRRNAYCEKSLFFSV